MFKNLLLNTVNFIVILGDSIAEGRKLRTEMMLRTHGVVFDEHGNVMPRKDR